METGDGGNNDLICSPYVHLFICLVPVAGTPMYPLRRVVSTVAFEISCKFAWADETVYLMGRREEPRTCGREESRTRSGSGDGRAWGKKRSRSCVILDPYEVIYSKTHVK